MVLLFPSRGQRCSIHARGTRDTWLSTDDLAGDLSRSAVAGANGMRPGLAFLSRFGRIYLPQLRIQSTWCSL